VSSDCLLIVTSAIILVKATRVLLSKFHLDPPPVVKAASFYLQQKLHDLYRHLRLDNGTNHGEGV
jgi:hypothetical protein